MGENGSSMTSESRPLRDLMNSENTEPSTEPMKSTTGSPASASTGLAEEEALKRKEKLKAVSGKLQSCFDEPKKQKQQGGSAAERGSASGELSDTQQGLSDQMDALMDQMKQRSAAAAGEATNKDKVDGLTSKMSTLLDQMKQSAVDGAGGQSSERVRRCEGMMGLLFAKLDQTKVCREGAQRLHDQLDESRQRLNDEVWAERERINAEHQEVVERMNKEHVEARARRAAERAKAAEDADKDTEEMEEMLAKMRRESKEREEALRARHAEEAKQTQQERHTRDKEYEEMMRISRERAESTGDTFKQKMAHAAAERKARQVEYDAAMQEEERLRQQRQAAREEECEALEREENEARKKAEEAREELRKARQEEAKADEAKSDAERRRRETFRERLFGSGFGGGRDYSPETDVEVKETMEFEEKFGDLEKAWARFEKRAASEAFVVTIAEVPFVTRPLLRRLLPTTDQRQKAFKRLAKRWHPDKFRQRFLGEMAKREEEVIMQRVKASFQVVQEMCQNK